VHESLSILHRAASDWNCEKIGRIIRRSLPLIPLRIPMSKVNKNS